ncbi:MAG: DUF5063 domain-containing protein [Bacteroidales bacterium]|nr:DUF5063 domain-containing protein [Bacteroidales bacterium]MBN2757632.1 DUF5063 domain-containing protein [Bacteroidales bacterium]
MNSLIEEIKGFLLVSAEYCFILENSDEYSKRDFISKIQKILSLIYLKTSLISNFDDIIDDPIEKFVQEADWEYIRSKIATKFGVHESFVDIYTPETFNTTEIDSASLSECITDIYQDLKDISTLVQVANEDSIKAGLSELKYNFESFWGPRLIAVLSVLHNLIYGTELEEEDDEEGNFKQVHENFDDIDTSKWIINQQFNNRKED